MSQSDKVLNKIRAEFNTEYYASYPIVKDYKGDLIEHYVNEGWKQGLNPNNDFSTAFYLRMYSDIREAGVNPFYHYLIAGRDEGRIAKEPDDYLVVDKEFDAQFYLETYPDIRTSGLDPLDHFMRWGWKENRNPNSNFSVSSYLSLHEDVRSAGVNPFWHYLMAGRNEGRPIFLDEPEPTAKNIPDVAQPTQTDLIRTIIEAEFDSNYYLAHNEDVRNARVDPLSHFIHEGWKEGRDPNPHFSSKHYLESNDDVRASNINPFYHFLTEGRAEGRSPKGVPGAPDSIKDIIAKEFDPQFYLSTYTDVQAANVDALEHYLLEGWKEGRDPTEDFSTNYYLSVYQDIRDAGVNPFYHYLQAGRNEGRMPVAPGGPRAKHLQSVKSLTEKYVEWASSAVEHELQASNKLFKEIDSAVRVGKWDKRTIVLSLSHDDYTKVPGGIQLCLKIEEREVVNTGGIYINLHPAQPLPGLSGESAKNLKYKMIVNGKDAGIAKLPSILSALTKVNKNTSNVYLIIHSLLGHSVEGLINLASTLKIKESFFWLHDYFSLCPQFNLLRNEINFCNAPQISSAGCSICIFGEDRIIQNNKLSQLFEKISFTVISPSEYALNFWQSKTALPYAKAVVHPHMKVKRKSSKSKVATLRTPADVSIEPIKVAYLGHPVMHKGWHTFKALAKELKDNTQFEFFHYGSGGANKNIRFKSVSVITDGPNAMIEALKADKIDIVILWSIWPETFCFTAHEALAAGTFLVASSLSGNVTKLIESTEAGLVFSNDEQLIKAFKDGAIEQAIFSKRRVKGVEWQLTNSGMTADYIKPKKEQRRDNALLH